MRLNYVSYLANDNDFKHEVSLWGNETSRTMRRKVKKRNAKLDGGKKDVIDR